MDQFSNSARGRADTSADDVVLVDRQDREIGTAGKLEAHRRGLTHRALSVILRDRQGRLLLQQRAAGKYHSPLLWTNTCCSHPRPGEDVADAAARRLAEEMGVVSTLTPLFTTHYRADVGDLIEDEFLHVFVGRFDGEPAPDPDEVEAWRWVDAHAIAADIDAAPERYTAWFRIFRDRYWPLIAGQGRGAV